MRRAIVLMTALATAMALAVPAIGAKKPAPDSEVSESLQEALAETSGTLDVLVSTKDADYSSVIDTVQASGGSVTHVFKYANGLAATLPPAGVLDLGSIPNVVKVGLDSVRSLPGTESLSGDEPTREAATAMDASVGAGFPLDTAAAPVNFDAATLESADPTTFWGYTPNSMNAIPVWAQGNFGQDSLIAVIDTGVAEDHVMFQSPSGSRVIGGIDLSTDAGTPFEGATRIDNHYHGSHVAGIAAGNAALCLPDGDLLLDSIELHGGVDFPVDPACSGDHLVPLLGMAPEAQLYAIKVFDHTGGSATESTVIMGIEHAIDLKVNDTLDVDVINMSLGGWTGYDGRDLEDQAVDAATAAGITVASAASNDGPYSMSINSPGTANTSITAAAATNAVSMRVFWDLNYGILGIGDLLYVDDNSQIAYFSSRGPTADGRDKPDAAAIGVFVLSASTDPELGTNTALAFASGTSMATPGLAGIAALLNTYGESVGAAPYDIKQAIVAGSHPLPGFDELDQGAGLVNAEDAYVAFLSDPSYGDVEARLKNGTPTQVVQPKGQKINVNPSNGTTFDVTLDPGMSQHYYFKLPSNAERFTLDVSNVDLGDDPLEFNSFEVGVEGGVRDTFAPYADSINVFGDASFVIEDLSTSVSGDVFGLPEDGFTPMPMMPGYWKVVIENDWTSADTVSGTFRVNVEKGNGSTKADESYKNKISQGDSFQHEVGFGPNGVMLDLSWKNNFQRYSTSDLDLIVVWVDSDGVANVVLDGATINSPEQVVIDADNIDQVFAIVDGFTVYENHDTYQLDVYYR